MDDIQIFDVYFTGMQVNIIILLFLLPAMYDLIIGAKIMNIVVVKVFHFHFSREHFRATVTVCVRVWRYRHSVNGISERKHARRSSLLRS